MSDNEQTQKAELIGSKMPKAEWETAIGLVGGKQGHVYIPKQHGEYSGKIILVTDTHVVQQVGKNVAIAHDITKLDNTKEIAALADSGKLQGKHFDFKYDDKGGQALAVSFNERRATEIKEKASEWAEKNITNVKSREAFLKHIDAMAKDMAKPSLPKVAKEAQGPSVPTPDKPLAQKR